MAEETYTVELLVDTGSSVATVQALGNLIAKLKADFPELGAVLGRVEQQLGKYAGATTNATATTDRLAAAATKAAAAADKQAAAEDKKALSLAKGNGQLDAHVVSSAAYLSSLRAEEAGVTAAAESTAIYNQYLYDQTLALTGVSVALVGKTETEQAAEISEAHLTRNTQLYNQALFEQQALLERTNQSLSTTRYALFSAAGSVAAFSAVLLALSLAPALVAISFQKEFAQVTRTVEGASQATENALIALSERIPVTFKDLAKIASAGGQLAIGADSIVQFTETVAKFSTTAKITTDVAGTLLARFAAFHLVDSSQFENLASAILKVGVSTVATDAQIGTIATRIVGISHIAGLGAAEIVGFAGALASVGIQPYAASGTVTRLFSSIDAAVSASSPKLAEYAKLAGVTSDVFAKAYGTSKFGPIFESFIAGLSDVNRNGGNTNKALAELGINSSIDKRTFTQLAGAADVVAKSFSAANEGFKSAATLNDQYNKIADTTSAKLKVLGNSVEAFFNSIGSAQTGILATAASDLSAFTVELTKLNSNPAGQAFLAIASGVGVLAGVLGLLTSVGFRMYAGIIGLTQGLAGLRSILAAAALEGSTATGALGALQAQLALMGVGGRIAAGGIGVATVALKALIATAALVTVGVLAGRGIASLENSYFDQQTGRIDTLAGAYNRLKGAKLGYNSYQGSVAGGNKDTSLNGALDGLGSGLFDLNRAFADFGLNSDSTVRDIKKIDDGFATLAKGGNINLARAQITGLADAQGITVDQLLTKLPSFTAEMAAEGVAFDQVAVTIEKVNNGTATTLDLTNALSQTLGETPKQLDAFSKAYTKSTDSLTSFNSIVKQVQDALQAKADAEAKATKSTKDSAATYYDGSVSLDQYTAQLEANNVKQREWSDNLNNIGLKDGGGEVVQQLVSAGYSVVNASLAAQLATASPAQWKAYIDATNTGINLASAAAAQRLTAGGYLTNADGSALTAATQKKIGDLLGAGFDVTTIMTTLNLKLQADPLVPGVDTKPAIKQIDGFITDVSGKKIPIYINPDIDNAQSILNQFINSNNGRTIALNATVNGSIPRNLRGVNTLTPAGGGYIRGEGTGTSDSIPAMVSNGEYVIKAASVRQYGAGLFDALNRGVARFASGGYVGQSQQAAPMSTGAGVNIQVVQNNPVTRDPIRQLKDDAANVLAGIWS